MCCNLKTKLFDNIDCYIYLFIFHIYIYIEREREIYIYSLFTAIYFENYIHIHNSEITYYAAVWANLGTAAAAAAATVVYYS